MVEEYVGACLCLEEAPKTSPVKRLLLGGTDKARKDNIYIEYKEGLPIVRRVFLLLLVGFVFQWWADVQEGSREQSAPPMWTLDVCVW